MMTITNLRGGLAEGMSPSDFDPGALREGTEHEMEHTDDPQVAQEIAMDHLAEDPAYYEKLALIENQQRSTLQTAWAAASVASAGACAYHGYRRNVGGSPGFWAFGWALFGAALPVIAVPVALAQGFGKQAGG
jgi:hypothetical protein